MKNYPDDYAKFKVGDKVNVNLNIKFTHSNPLIPGMNYTIRDIRAGTPTGIYYTLIERPVQDWYWEEDLKKSVTEERRKKLEKIFKNS